MLTDILELIALAFAAVMIAIVVIHSIGTIAGAW